MTEFMGKWTRETITLNDENLTENEIKVMIGIRNNDYSDIVESGSDWSFAVCDESGLNEKVYRGVASSLIKKGFINIDDYGDDPLLSLTDEGRKLYSDYKPVQVIGGVVV